MAQYVPTNPYENLCKPNCKHQKLTEVRGYVLFLDSYALLAAVFCGQYREITCLIIKIEIRLFSRIGGCFATI